MSEPPARRLNGRVAVVTGGAQGIGFGMARCFAEEGAAVVIAEIKEQAVKGAAAMLSAGGAAASGFGVDIGDDANVAAPGTFIEEKHGRCQILVNNAAIADGTGIEAMTMQRYHEGDPRQPGRCHPGHAGPRSAAKEGRGGEAHPQHRVDHGCPRLASRGAIPCSTAKGAIFTRA
jgi:hypothetical protein